MQGLPITAMMVAEERIGWSDEGTDKQMEIRTPMLHPETSLSNLLKFIIDQWRIQRGFRGFDIK